MVAGSLTVLTVVLEVSKPAVVVVLLWPPGITVDSLTSVSGRCRNAEGPARTYLIVSLDVVCLGSGSRRLAIFQRVAIG